MKVQVIKGSPLLFLYFFPIFIVNIDLGSIGEVFLRSQFILYPLIVAYFYYKKKDPVILFGFIFGIVVFSLYGISYVLGDKYEYILDSFIGGVVLLMYLLVSLVIYRATEENRDTLLYVLDKFILYSVVFIFSSYLIWSLTGLHVLADDGYGYFRPHAFMSEPSALTPFLAYAFSASILNKKHLQAFFVLVAIFVAGSIIALFVSVIVLMLSYFYNLKLLKKIILVSAVSLCIMFMYDYILNYYSLGGSVYDSQMARLRQALLSFESLGQEGYNPRVATTVDMVAYLLQEPIGFLLGHGPLSDKFLPFSDVARSAPSLPMVMFFNFGFISMCVLLIWVVKGILACDVKDKINLLFVCLAISSLVNSAQGLLIYQLVFLLGFMNKGKSREIPST